MSNHLVFVYGSLCSGLSNSSLLVRGGARLLGIGKTIDRYDMYDLGMFPGVVENDEGKQILGELYVVNEELLRVLDSLEGCPHFYQRKVKKITFGNDLPAAPFMYILNKTSLHPFDIKIPANDWRSYYHDKIDKMKREVESR